MNHHEPSDANRAAAIMITAILSVLFTVGIAIYLLNA